MPTTVPPEDRIDLHNPSVDEGVASRGACAEVHLPTGRTCTREYGHDGSCDFVPRDRVEESLAGHGLTADEAPPRS
jgi:hypothetical protein